MPERIQMSRQKPWRAEHPDAVIVARPSRWGNPFRVRKMAGERPSMWMVTTARAEGDRCWSAWTTEHNAIKAAVDLFQLHHGPFGDYEPDDDWLLPLVGRDLACWCPLDRPCHADVLLGWVA